MRTIRILMIVAAATRLMSCDVQRWKEEDKGQYMLVTQRRGAALGYSHASGVRLLFDAGYAFKDLNRNNKIDVYEDWRKPMAARAKDLVSQLSIDEIAGLMLYSEHQAVPTDEEGKWASTYNGVKLSESGLPHSAISDKQRIFLSEDNLRAVLLVRAESSRIAAEWSNNLQSFVEGIGHGIPVNISSDPRHEAEAWGEFNAGSGGKISQWPCQLGLAATFDPDIVKEFGMIAAKEYRALGIATALSPQADLATEPRWFRNYGTFGEDPSLSCDMVRAYIDGFQTSSGKNEIEDGWGYESVNTMVKHWPGGGSGEGGRDAHYGFGKYSVYPGAGLKEQIKPFIEGAFKLNGKTASASAVMPYYTISYGLDPSGKNVGNSYSRYIIFDLLRDQYAYDGVICTDWEVTHDEKNVFESDGKPWGNETLSESERHYEILKAGVDQFGGNNDKTPVLEAYRMWEKDFGLASARDRFEQSAVRLLMNMFRTGLFDNPYVDPEKTEALVGCPEFMKAGYAAQLRSIVMLKNHGAVIPQAEGRKVWFPQRYVGASKGFFGPERVTQKWEYSIDTALIRRHYIMVENPEDADFALVSFNEPEGGHGYDSADLHKGGNGYMPISLQYGEYKAVEAREISIAGGDPFESFTNRSYRGKTVTSYNATDADMVRITRMKMGEKPVIVAVSCLRPFVPAEIEPYADAFILGFGVQNQAILDIVRGEAEPKGLLPMQMPADMSTVEHQCEDRPGDMVCYTDSDGYVWDFAFGMNWAGPINDARVEKYGHANSGSTLSARNSVPSMQ